MGIKSACMAPRGGFWAHLTCVEISWAHLAQGSPGGDLVGSGGLWWAHLAFRAPRRGLEQAG